MQKEKRNVKLEYSSYIFEHLKNVFQEQKYKIKVLQTKISVLLFLSHLKQNNLERIKTT